ncbi:MAG: PKD domain-containing protein [Flavobacteriales bacterium]|nr:PKD domain-containing protein [Flavobacteriales bacterium]
MKNLFLAFAILMPFLANAMPPPTNDDPCGATVLTVGTSCTYVAGSMPANSTGTVGIPAPTCSSYPAGSDDVWYSVTVPASGNLTIDMNTGTLTDMGMAWYTATSCSGTFTQIACDDDGSVNGLMPYLSVSGLTPGTTIYVRLWDYGGNDNGNFSICASTNNTTVPSNDNPCGATPLTVYPSNTGCTTTSGNNSGATTTSQTIPAPGCAFYSGNEVFYSFTVPASGAVNVQTYAGSLTDMGMAAYTATSCSGTFTLISCNDDAGGTTMPQLNLSGLTPGTTVYLMVWDYGGTDFGSFSLCVTESATGGGTGPCLAGAVNTNCNSADPFCTGTAYNYCNTTGVASMGQYNCLYSTPNPMWMYLNIATSGPISININQYTTGGVGIDVDFALWGPFTSVANACANIAPSTTIPTTYPSGNLVDCSYSASYTETADIPNAVAGQWYMLLITNYNGSAGYIQFSQSGGTGATNCNIVSPCSITTTQTNVTCNGGNNGTATATPSGTGPFSYSWSPAPGGGQGTASVTGLSAGTYTVTVTASGGVTCTQSVTITQPTAITATTTQTNVACNGGTTGSIVVTASGGTAPYNISWTGTTTGNPAGNEIASSGGTYTLNALGAGTYNITVTDANGCTRVIPSVTITQPTAITATLTPTAVACVGGNNGSIAVTASGGTAGYNVSWIGPSSGAPVGTEIASSGGSYSITGLVAGTYTVTVTDANGCTRTASSTVNPGVTIDANITPVAAQCLTGNSFNFSGTTSTISSGSITSYSWNFGDATTGTGSTVSHTYGATGTYTVTLTVSNGTCTNTETLSVTVNPNPAVTLTVTPPNCFGQNGTITANPTGGSSFGYAWNPPAGQATQTVSVPVGGPYSVTVTNNFGCTATASASMTQPTQLTATMGTPTMVNCNGGNNGSVSVTAAGGTAPYTYNWSPAPGSGQGTANAGSLTAGTYTVTVTDNKGCTATASVTITQPTVLTATMGTPTMVNCNGGNNGSVSVTATGGTAAYNVSWTGPTSGNPAGNEIAISGGNYSITGMTAGTYTVTITDNKGCTATASVTITQPAVLTATMGTPTMVSCNAGNNGSVSVTAAGGTAPYTYNWSPAPGSGQGTANAGSLTAGTYTVTITDNKGCTATASVTITQPTVLTATMGTPTMVSCNGGNNGSVSVTAAGGTAPYTYNWSPAPGSGQGTANAGSLTAGTYSVTITDNKGCTATASVTITQPTVLTATMGTPTMVSCNGGNNGSVSVTAAGGTAPYTYNWSPAPGSGQGTANAGSLTAGTYSVTITDNKGCTATASVTITQPTALTATMGTPTMVSCNGGNNGSVSVTAAGGTAPYTYNWSPAPGSGQGTANAGLLTAGTYTVTITDNKGCTATASVTITQPTALTATMGTPTMVSCNGGNNGSVSVTAAGGTAPYTYNWSPAPGAGQGTAAASSLTAGTYTVTITDNKGCTATASVTITQPAVLTATMGTPTMVSCNGGNNGSVSVTAAGGTAPYTYNWSPAPGSGQGTANAGSLTAGTYSVTITDNKGCTATASVTITQPTVLTATMGTPTMVSCNGGNNGSVSVTAAGGTAPYMYNWSPAPGSGQGTANAGSLTAGTYTVTVTDNKGCTATASVTITQPTALTATMGTPTMVSCNGGNNGSVSVTAAGGSAPYTYNWSPAPGAGQGTAAASSLTAGTYTVTITDNTGCTTTASATITQPAVLTATMGAPTMVSCNGGNNGSVSVTAAGGTAPYTYNWSPAPGSGQGTANAGSLTAGSYTVTITDNNGCSATSSVAITQPTAISLTTASTPTNCGASTGTTTVTATGGAGSYTYSWNTTPVQSTATASNLLAGTYTVTVTDLNGCTATATVSVNNNAAPTITENIASHIDVLCNGGNNGAAAVTVSGGTAPLSISWSPSGGTSATASGLTAGIYTVTVTDANLCAASVNIIITQPPVLTATASTTQQVLCNGGNNGAVSVSAAGGTGALTYSWSPSGGTASTASGLTAGTYTVTVTDANSCTITASTTITQPTALTSAMGTPTMVSCNGGNNGSVSVTATGGTAPYTYNWSPAPGSGQGTANAGSMTAGAYTVTITDANGCTSTSSVTITQPTVLTSTMGTPTMVSCNGGNNGSVSVTVAGGTTPYTYNWSPAPGSGQGTANAGSLTAGTYTVTITDANGCTSTSSVTITQPTVLTSAMGTPTMVSCNGGNNGSVSVTAAGGTTAYSYNWSPAPGSGQGTANAGSMTAGTYTVTITDANGCTSTSSVTITQPTVLTSTMGTPTMVSCNGGNNGSVNVTAAGGTTPYAYSWSPAPGSGQGTSSAGSMTAGSYTVTVTDANNCTSTATVTITEPVQLAISTSTTNATCGASNGTATAAISGGVTPYNISWNTSPVQTSSTATGLPAGSYTVSVTDANGCTFSQTANVINDAAPTIVENMISHVDVSCNGGNNGVAAVTVAGGTNPLSISWSPSGGSSANASGLTAGSYTVTVTDANGCSATTNITITEPAALVASMGTPTMVSCNGGNNGSASVSITGGVSPYSYAWSPVPGGGQGTAAATGLLAGSYSVTITDANACTQTATVTITEPTLLTVSTIVTPVSCNGGSNGTATATIGGGVSPYTQTWSPAPGAGQNTTNASSMNAGTYTITVTDANGCTQTATATITEPAALALSTTVVDAHCGQADGSATVTATGGTNPITYSWNTSPVQTTASATAIPAGNYTVTATDANGCVSTISATVGTIAGPSATAVVNSNVTGAGLCNGSATVTPSGGTSPYTILWDNSNTNATANDLCAGNNCATITDAAGCVTTACVTITEPAPLTVTLSPTNLTCFNICTGQVNSLAAGGVAPYTYSWSNGASTVNIINVCANTYTVTVTDANGNTATASVAVTQPTDIVISNTTATPALCNGACNGTVNATAAGGTGALTYTWTGGLTGASQSGLCAGTYSLVVADVNGCTETSTAVVTEPAVLTASTTVVNANCGNSDGSATVTAAGGTAPYSYSWSSGGVATTENNLAANTYNVTVTDANGCTVTVAATVGNNPAGTLTMSVVNNVLCFGANDGSASGVMTGGAAPFTYSWNTSPVQTTSTATNLAPGVWTLSVTDANSCIITGSVTITEPTLLVATPSAVDVNCFGGSDGSVSVSATGGSPAYNLTWTNSGGTVIGTTPNQSGLIAGTYTVSVNDDNGCNSTASVVVNEPPAYSLSLSSLDVKCFGACNGNASATVTGGTTPYTYAWNDPLNQTTSGAFFLCPGNYTVTVTDDHGCTLSASATISEPAELTNTITAVDAHCQQNDGSGCVTPSGGITPYTLQWLSVASTNNCESNLFSGTYLVQITDANQCLDTAVIQINDIAGPSAAIIAQTNVSCNGLDDGSATVDMIGGTGIFTVQWDAAAFSQTTPTASNLPAGTYSVTVTDAAGCAASTNVTITEPPLVVYIPTAIDPTCFTYCDGVISIAVTGGVTPYNFDWRDNANASIGTTSSVNGLCDGNYTLILSDANGCTNIIPYQLTEPVAVTGSISGTNNLCFQSCDGTATLVANSGVAPFSFSWNDPAAQTTSTASSLCAGNYSVTLTDADGCFNSYNVSITEPTLLTATIDLSGNVSCAGVCDGFANGVASGGTAPYTYSWSNGVNTQMNNGLCVGTYTFTVTDANGCTATATVNIIEPSSLAVSVSGTDISCFNACDGTMAAAVSGGTTPYSIQWFDPSFATTANVSNVCAGTYDVIVTDANGCSVSNTVTLNQPSILSFAISTVENAFCGQNNGQICASVIGGVAPYTFQYDDPAGQITPCAFNLFSGCYTLTVTDGNGCVKDSLICISDIPGPTLAVTSHSDVTCFGASDGEIVISATGGTNPLVIEWLDGANNVIPAYTGQTTVSTLPGDTYGIVVTDSANCVVATSQFIFEPTGLNAAVTSTTSPLCFGGCDGAATVSMSGGTTPYTIAWSGGANTTSANNTGLCAGNYSAVITDANGCQFTANTTITQPTQLVVNTTSLQNVSCNAVCDGIVNLGVSGATAPYFYSWTNNVSVGSTATNLCAGNYITDVTDNHGCLVTVSNTITEPAALAITVSVTDATCSQCNGASSALVTGGTTPYAYSWTSGAAMNAANNTGLCAGVTDITVTDAHGCVITSNATIIDQAGPVITGLTFTEPLCYGQSNGTATVNTTGGTAPLTYAWDDPAVQTTQTATNLVTGLYCVVVSDNNNCNATNCVDVTEPNPLGAVGDLDVTICYGDSTQLWASGTGGTTPYTVNWQTPGLSGPGPIMVNPLTTTTYCFDITDANGCLSPQDCITITVNPPLDVDVSPTIAICLNDSTTLAASASGGNGGPYTFTWYDQNGATLNDIESGNQSTVTVNPSVDTWYTVKVDDGCSIVALDSVQVTINDLPIVFFNVVDSAGCAPFTAQFILNTDIGVNFDYDFQCDGVVDYSGTSPNTTFTYPNPGTYDVCVTVTSALGCVTTVSQTEMVDVYPVPVADFSTTPGTTTILSPTITFGDLSTGTPVTYQWDFGDGFTLTGAPGVNVPANTHNGLTIGTFDDPIHTYADTGTFDVTLFITNQYGCTDVITYQVTVEGDYILFTPNTFTPNGDGKNDVFIPVGIGISMDEYEMLVFNRWGELIFETHNPNTGWDGTHKGEPAKQDVYVWKVKAFDHRGVQHDYIGHITLLR